MSGVNADTAVGLPSPALRSFITKYAGFRISGLPSGVHFGLPSSGVHLIISLGNPIELLQTPNCAESPLAFTAFIVVFTIDPPSCGRMTKRLGCTYSSNHSALKQFWVLQAPTYHQSFSVSPIFGGAEPKLSSRRFLTLLPGANASRLWTGRLPRNSIQLSRGPKSPGHGNDWRKVAGPCPCNSSRMKSVIVAGTSVSTFETKLVFRRNWPLDYSASSTHAASLRIAGWDLRMSPSLVATTTRRT